MRKEGIVGCPRKNKKDNKIKTRKEAKGAGK
jgi:hypothetical protein